MTSSLEVRLAEILSIARRPLLDRLLTERQRSPEMRVVASLTPAFPTELAQALDLLHVPLGAAALGSSQLVADNGMCIPAASATALAGWSVLGALVLGAGCDVDLDPARIPPRSPAPLVHTLDLRPGAGESALGACERALGALISALEVVAARRLAPIYLRAAIHLMAETSIAIESLTALHRERPRVLPLSDLAALLIAGHTQRRRDHCFDLRAIAAELATATNRRPAGRSRWLVRGLHCWLGAPDVLARIEAAGVELVGDDLGARALRARPPRSDGAALTALAETYAERRSVPTAPQALVERARLADADGVLFVTPGNCPPAQLDAAAHRAALTAAAISSVSGTARAITADPAALAQHLLAISARGVHSLAAH